jgi:hypothetical protein
MGDGRRQAAGEDDRAIAELKLHAMLSGRETW